MIDSIYHMTSYLTVSITDLCTLSYFYEDSFEIAFLLCYFCELSNANDLNDEQGWEIDS